MLLKNHLVIVLVASGLLKSPVVSMENTNLSGNT